MKPPKYFDAVERAIWRELLATAPTAMMPADVPTLELLVGLIRKQRDRVELSANERSSLIKLLDSFGRSPQARKRLTVPNGPPEQNEFAELD